MMTSGAQRSSIAGHLVMTLRRFGARRRGAVTPIMALALIPILMAMGMAAEASNWWLTQRNLQHAADSAALAAAIDAGNYASGLANGNGPAYTSGLPTATPNPTNCSGTWSGTTSWYCAAKSTSAQQGYTDGVNTVTVTPTAGTCTVGNNVASVCYKVKVTKNVPIYLLTLMGFSGNATFNGARAELINATAVAAAPGPPVDFCILTTNGDFTTNGAPNADLKKCSVFANGNANCSGHGLNIYADYATGSASCPSPDLNVPQQSPQCDPYGATTQTIQGQSVSCPLSTNASSNIPSAASQGCSSPNSLAASSGSFPTANIITQTMVNNAAAGTGVIAICGNAAFGSGTVDSSKGVNTCTSPILYSGTTNIQIIVYNGGLNTNGCTFQDAGTGTVNNTTYGGTTIIFAPMTETAGQTCPNNCIPIDTNNNPGTLDIAAPTSGSFSGLAIMQSANYSQTNGGCNPSGTQSGPLDWCNAGNSPTLKIQGLLYFPNGELQFSGAVSKFNGTGALNCVAIIAQSFQVNGTSWTINNFGTASLTGQCSTAGVTLPGIPGSHTFYQALVA